MTVTYLYHSGFTVEFEDIMLVFDYYKGELPETAKGKKLYVFSSHYHKDHFQYKIFDWAKEYNTVYILSRDIRAKGPEGRTMKVGRRQELSVDGIQIRTLRSTDEGVAFFVRVRGVTIYHAGDLNWWHWEGESKAWNNNMAANYKQEVDRLSGQSVDVAFLPLDPRLSDAYSWGMGYFLEKVKADHVYPMHCWDKYEICEQVKKEPGFQGLFGQYHPLKHPGQEWEIC